MPEKRTIFILPILVHFHAVADSHGTDHGKRLARGQLRPVLNQSVRVLPGTDGGHRSVPFSVGVMVAQAPHSPLRLLTRVSVRGHGLRGGVLKVEMDRD